MAGDEEAAGSAAVSRLGRLAAQSGIAMMGWSRRLAQPGCSSRPLGSRAGAGPGDGHGRLARCSGTPPLTSSSGAAPGSAGTRRATRATPAALAGYGRDPAVDGGGPWCLSEFARRDLARCLALDATRGRPVGRRVGGASACPGRACRGVFRASFDLTGLRAGARARLGP